MSRTDVVALGELLIDFINTGTAASGNPLFEANPGDAPCNVLAMLQKLNRITAFIGKVGSDFHGDFLERTVRDLGINVSCLSRDKTVPTTLAFVSNTPDGERSFSFYRNPGADVMLSKSDIDFSLIDDSRIFHFGSLSMTNPVVEEATKAAVDYAKKKGKLISFDPNLRPLLWKDPDTAKEKIAYGLSVCDVLKISDNELEFVTGTADIGDGIRIISEKYNPSLLCVTMGKGGSIAVCGDTCVKVDAFLNENTVDTTGAGDTFMGCVLDTVLAHGLKGLGEDELKNMLVFANAAASVVTTRKGALLSMPTSEEISSFLADRNSATTNG